MKKSLSLFLIALLTFACLMIPASAEKLGDTDASGEYTISRPYQYELEPYSEEWYSITQSSERVKLLQIPETVIKEMTTEALLLTLAKNPYIADVYAYNTIELGVDMTSSYVCGLKEFLERDDSQSAVKKLSQSLNDGDSTYERYIDNETLRIRLDLLQGIMGVLSVDSVNATSGYVTTPNGSSVPVINNATYSYWGTTISAVQQAQASLLSSYPSATVVRSVSAATAAYNCHSYAWYSTASSNSAWMNSPVLYMTDGSYTQSTARVGSKIYWKQSNGTPIHSGILTSLGSPNVVTSKWGLCGVIRHNIDDSPYSNAAEYGSGISITAWN